jgi:hypothetical protein
VQKLNRAVGGGFIPGASSTEPMRASAPEACIAGIRSKACLFRQPVQSVRRTLHSLRKGFDLRWEPNPESPAQIASSKGLHSAVSKTLSHYACPAATISSRRERLKIAQDKRSAVLGMRVTDSISPVRGNRIPARMEMSRKKSKPRIARRHALISPYNSITQPLTPLENKFQNFAYNFQAFR